uniref:PDZ domain-containing protein n=1 Tax=Picea sitchensis TaxID=3332 RepID=A9NL96_PICSI|nr:unknown [Picea sitchensis]
MASTAIVSPSSSTLHSRQQPISSPNASRIQTSCFFGMSLFEAKGGLSISKAYNTNTNITRTGMPLVRARTAGASKSIEVDVDKPLGLALGPKSGGGVLVTGIENGGNAEKAGLKVGDQVLYTSSFFGDELWPADKLGFTKTAIQAKPDSVYFVVSRGAEVDVKRLPKRPAPPRFGRKLTEAQKARATHICLDCGYIYTLTKSFDEQRDDFVCAQCSAPKKRFARYDVEKGKPIGGSLPPIGVILGLVVGVGAVGALLLYGLQ